MAVKPCQVLQVEVSAIVDGVIANEYGKGYRADKLGIIHLKDEKNPYDSPVGTWHIKDNKLVAIVNSNKIK